MPYAGLRIFPELERAIGGFFIELCTMFQDGIDPKERCGNIDRLLALSAGLSPLPAGKSHGGVMELPLRDGSTGPRRCSLAC